MGETAASEGRSYAGLPGAFRYAFGRTPSYLCKSYVVVSALLGLLATVFFVLALLYWVANPTGAVGERALLGVIALLVLLPLFAPVLLVARRHRRTGSDGRYDRLLGLAGYAFVFTLWLGMAVAGAQPPRPGPFEPVVAVLYRTPGVYGLVPPVVGAALVWLTHRYAE